jgi:predicted RNA-binding protein (virulence factor B family)
MSKKAFKQALAKLYKKRQILITEAGIEAVDSSDPASDKSA